MAAVPSRTDDALVLARYPFRERDFVVVLLTGGGGQVRVVAHRARSSRASSASATEPLARIRATYFERPGAELATLDDADVVRSAFDLAREPLAWAAGQVLAELAMIFCPPGQRNEAAFRLVDACVECLLARRDPVALVHYGELWFLRLAGVFPELDRCGACGARLPRGDRVYDPTERGFTCADHRPAGRVVRLTAAAADWLRSASHEPPEAVAAPAPADAVDWLIGLREHFTDRRVESWGYLRRLLREDGAARPGRGSR